MSTRTKIEVVVAAILLLVLVLGVYLYHEHALGLARTQTKADSQEQVIKENAATIAQREAALQQYMVAVQKQIAAVTSIKQAAPIIQTITPQQPAPVIVPAAQMPQQIQQQLPNSPSYTVLTEQQSVDVAKFKLLCDATGKQLETCTENTATLQNSLKTSRQESAGWEQEAKGSFWKRAGNCALRGGAGGVGGALSGKVQNVGIGAGIGLATCLVWKP
jgi:hypothetical protein